MRSYIFIKLFLLTASIAVAQNTVKSPNDFLPHRVGDKFTPHHMLTAYFEYLAANSPSTMRLERYGSTYESRPLQLAFFSSAENLSRLEEIRITHLRHADPGAQNKETGTPVAVVWLSMSVHGNEPSGSECSMLLAYQLATQTESQIQEWLKNTVVIIDPSVNPDGYDRYTHWNRMASNRLLNPNPNSREHREPWPGGRVNHYYFDLNRDWAWATQVETRQRLEQYQRWLPHIHADLHEQYINNPYYFAPAAEPTHDYLTPWQRSFQEEIGQNHAGYFDKNGWLYFTKEVFDLLYPAYGDTYPLFNGAIGMTYEQAGHSTAGRAIITASGDTLRLSDRIQHHLTTSRSTIEMASKNAGRLADNFIQYYKKSAATPPGKYTTFIIRENNDPARVNALLRLLDIHKIRYGLAGAERTGLKAFDYRKGQDTIITVRSNDIVISAFQAKSILAQVLFEPEPRLTDSLTYDITAWALPFAYGLQAYAATERLEPKKNFEAFKPTPIRLAASPYAWVVAHSSLAGTAFAGELMQKGLHVRLTRENFRIADQHFQPGAYVVTRADNRDFESPYIDATVQQAAQAANIQAHAIFTGFSTAGRDLGSEFFALMQRPSVALLFSDDVDENAFGAIWHFFEQDLNYPLDVVPMNRIKPFALNDYNVIILPPGNYSISESLETSLSDWVRNGGRLIACEGGVKALANKEGFGIKLKIEEKSDTSILPTAYQSRERARVSESVPGAVVRADVDNTHPLAYGLSTVYFSLKTTPDVYELEKGTTAVAWLKKNYTKYGFIGSKLAPRFGNSPVAAVQPMGNGEVIYFMDFPVFRSFWYEGKLLFANAIFH